MSTETAIGIAFLVVCLGGSYVFVVSDWLRRWSFERALSHHAEQAESAATAASQDNNSFDPQVIREAVETMIAWALSSPDGRSGAQERPDADLLRTWTQLHGLTTSRQRVKDVDVQLVQVSNPVEGHQVVEARVKGHGPRRRRVVDRQRGRIDERWTLQLMDGRWVLIAYGPATTLKPMLHSTQVASPVDDEQHLRSRALRELALDDESDGDLDGLIDSDLAPARQAQDLATVDGRFATEVIENAVRALIEAWQQPKRLQLQQRDAVSRATPEAILQLLCVTPKDDTRLLVVRDAELEDWKIAEIDLLADRPQITLKVTVTARRYLAAKRGRDASTLGNKAYHHAMKMRWTLELDDRAPELWRLISTTNPATEIPGALP